jgi:hypothetical protein
MTKVKVQKAKTDEAVKIIIDEKTKAETYIVNEATAKTFNAVTAIDKKFASAINKFSNAISFDDRCQQGTDWNACLETIRTVNEKATGRSVFNIACAIDPSIVKLKEKIGNENYLKMVDARGKNAKLVTILEANTDIKTETVNWKNAFNLTQDEATKLSTGRLLNINRALNKKTAKAEPPKQVTALELITDMFALATKHKINEHAIAIELEPFMVKFQSELHAKAMSDLQAKNKELREQQEVVNNRVATTNAKKLNANRKKAEAPKIVEVNDKLEAIALEKKNRNMAMFGISA